LSVIIIFIILPAQLQCADSFIEEDSSNTSTGT